MNTERFIGFKLAGLSGWWFFRAEHVEETDGRVRCKGAGWYLYSKAYNVVTVTDLAASERAIEARTETEGLP